MVILALHYAHNLLALDLGLMRGREAANARCVMYCNKMNRAEVERGERSGTVLSSIFLEFSWYCHRRVLFKVAVFTSSLEVPPG